MPTTRHLLALLLLVSFGASPLLAEVPRKVQSKQDRAYKDAAKELLKLGRFCAKNRAYDEAAVWLELGLELVPADKKLSRELEEVAAEEPTDVRDDFAEDYPEERLEALQECGDALVELIVWLDEEGYDEYASLQRDQLAALFTGEAARFPTLLSPAARTALLGTVDPGGYEWEATFCSKYYDFYTNGDIDTTEDYAQAMDLMYDNYCDIFQYHEAPRQAFPVLLYADQQQFMSLTGMGPNVGGFYDGGKIVGFHGGLRGLSVLEVLFHEGTHQFQGLVLGDNMWGAKTWFIEGLAVYFEASEIRGRKLKTGVIPRERLNSLKRAVRVDAHTSLQELIRLEQYQFTGFHYAHGWALIYFFVHGTTDGRERFKDYFTRVQNGTYEGVSTFEEIFDKPMHEIEEAWKAFVLSLD